MKHESMEDKMEAFLEWLAVRNYSERTIHNHRRSLSIFFEWCKERELFNPSEITRPVLERYQQYLFHYRNAKTGKPISFRSQGTRLSSVRSYFKWLARMNYILFNPAADLELPRGERRLPKHVLTKEEAEKIMNQTNVKDPLGIRDRAILETFYSTGIRRTELTKLNLYDLDKERGTLMIRQGKGKKDRVIPVGERAQMWIEKYMHDVRPTLVVPPDDGVLFLTGAGKPFVPKRLGELVHNYVADAKIGKEGSCHLFRHTMATLMLENGADIRYIQQMLGHENLETTEVYTQVSIGKLKEIHTQTHPAKMRKQSL